METVLEPTTNTTEGRPTVPLPKPRLPTMATATYFGWACKPIPLESPMSLTRTSPYQCPGWTHYPTSWKPFMTTC